MSHFTVMAIIRKGSDSDLESMLAPYDENMEVAPYVRRTKAELIAKKREEAARVAHDIPLAEAHSEEEYRKLEDVRYRYEYVLSDEGRACAALVSASDDEVFEAVKKDYEGDHLDENGNFQITRDVECMNQEQLDWLVSTLAAVPENYHVLIAFHSYPDSGKIVKCDWTQANITGFGGGMPLTYGKSEIVPDVVNAWINGESLNKDYEPIANTDILPILKVRADFSARGKGAFIAYLTGHNHIDFLGTSGKYPDQNVIAFPTSANDNWNNLDCDLPRERNTKAEDCLTVLAVDRESRVFHLVRVGSNFTKSLVNRTYYSVSY